MKGKIYQPKPPLSRRRPRKSSSPKKAVKKSDLTDDSGSEILHDTFKRLSPKSKCFKKTQRSTVSLSLPSGSRSGAKKSAFDYSSDNDGLECDEPQETDNERVQAKENCSSSQDVVKINNSQDDGTADFNSRYKKSQLALKNVNTDKKGKKRKVPKSLRTYNLTSDEEDFSQKPKKKPCLSLSHKVQDVLSKDGKGKANRKSTLKLKRKNTSHKRTNDADGEIPQKDREKGSDLEHDHGFLSEEYGHQVISGPVAIGDIECGRENNENDENIKMSSNKQASSDLKEESKCPVCGKVFDILEELTFISHHVNNCIDSQTEEDIDLNIAEKSEKNAKSSLSLLQDQLTAFEYQNKKDLKPDSDYESELFFCQICHKDLSKMNTQRRTQHMNKCCDKVESIEGNRSTQAANEPSIIKNQLPCPFCQVDMKSKKALLIHIKKCAQKHQVPTAQVLEIKNQIQEVDFKINDNLAVKTSSNPTQAKKKKTIKPILGGVDEATQLAMAMSASMTPSLPKDNDLVKKQKRKRNKGNEVIPALLLRSKEETQSVIAARVAEVVCMQNDEVDDEDIPCTPALEPSSVAQRFVTATKVNGGLASTGNTSTVLDDQATTDEASNEQLGSDNTTLPMETPVISLSEMKDNIEMCQSFLGFLANDEENIVSNNKKISSNRKDSLWSLASLNDEEDTRHSFYVPGLLPACSPKRPRTRTPRKLSSRSKKPCSNLLHINHNHALSQEAKVERISKQDPARNASETDNFTSSQAKKVDILLELAGVSDDEESTQQSITCDDDDDMFPSSGFCVPINLNVQTEKLTTAPSPCVNLLLEDLSNMVGNSWLSDVTILTKDNQTIPAHSFMLALRCKALADMITDAREADNATYHLPVSLKFDNVHIETMRHVLDFIYTSTVNIPRHLTLSVKQLAERLDLEELIKVCTDSMTCSEGHQHDEDEDVTERAISTEDLLNEIRQKETGDSELKQDDQEISQEDWEQGFDDDDIQEVRIFQTQSSYNMRTISEDQRNQDSVQTLFGLIETECGPTAKDVMQNCDSENQTVENVDNHQHESLNYDLTDGKVEDVFHDELACAIEQPDMSFDQKCKEVTRDSSLPKGTPKECEFKVHHSGLVDIETHDNTVENERDGSDSEKGEPCHKLHGNTINQDTEGTQMEGIDANKDGKSLQTNVTIYQEEALMGDSDSDIASNSSPKDHEGIMYPDVEGKLEDDSRVDKTSESCNKDPGNTMYQDLEDRMDDNDNDEARPSPNKDPKDSMYQDIDNDSDEHDGNVAMLSQSISLLSDNDDDDCGNGGHDDDGGLTSPPDKVINGVVPETPHPKAKIANSDYNRTLSSNASQDEAVGSTNHSLSGSTSSLVNSDSSDSANDEDGDTFLEKLRANVKANQTMGKTNRKKTQRKKVKSQKPAKDTAEQKGRETGVERASLRKAQISSRRILACNDEVIEGRRANYINSPVDESKSITNNPSKDEEDKEYSLEEISAPSSPYHSPVRVLSPMVPSPPCLDYPSSPSGIDDDNHVDLRQDVSPVNYLVPMPTTPLSSMAASPLKSNTVDLTLDEFQDVDEGGEGPSRAKRQTIYSESDSEKSGVTYSCWSTSEEHFQSTKNDGFEDNAKHEKYASNKCRSINSIKSGLSRRNAKEKPHSMVDLDMISNDNYESQDDKNTSSHGVVNDFDDGGYNCDVDEFADNFRDSQPKKAEDTDTFDQVAFDDFDDDGGYNCDAEYMQCDDDSQRSRDQDVSHSNQVIVDDFLDDVGFHDDGGHNCDGDFLQADHNSQPQRGEGCSPSNPAPAFHDDGGYNCDADDFADCLHGDDSFMANAADELEQLREKCPSSKFSTSVINTEKQSSTKGANSKVPSPITPIPDFQSMDTPGLRSEVSKFGVRALPKKKMIAKLNEIHHYMRQVKHGHSSSENDARNTNPPPKVSRRAASQVQNNSDSDDNSRPSQPPTGRKLNRAKNTKKIQQKKDKSKENVDIHSQETCLTEDLDTLDCGVEIEDYSTGAATDESDNDEEFGEVSVLIDSEAMSSQQVQSDDLKETLRLFVINNEDIYLKVLHYQPIDFMALHEQIKSDGIQCSAGKLLDFLDEQCICFTTAGQKPRRTRKKAPKKN